MHTTQPLWHAPSFTAAPTGQNRNYMVAVQDRSGTHLATCDSQGTVHGHAGEVLLTAPLQWNSRYHRAKDAGVELVDAHGRPSGSARVIKYGVGPCARKATLAILDPAGNEVARLEPRDHKGEDLVIHADGSELAKIAVSYVKAGFLRKSRVYTIDFAEHIPGELRPLLLAVAVRYDAVLDAVVAAVARDSD